MHFTSTVRLARVLSLLLLLATATGCQQRAASILQGRWEGRPDTAEARAQREAEKYGDEPTAEAVAAKTSRAKPTSDWENYDVTIQMNFVSSDQVEMSLGGEQPRSGRWHVVSQAPTSCIIEVVTESEQTADKQSEPVRRRFELLLDERDGACVGFLLTEAGADRQQGAIYFQRPK